MGLKVPRIGIRVFYPDFDSFKMELLRYLALKVQGGEIIIDHAHLRLEQTQLPYPLVCVPFEVLLFFTEYIQCPFSAHGS